MDPALLADLIVVLHLAIVAFVVAGEVLVLVGGPLRWAWVRNPSFRIAHLGDVVFVAVEGAFGVLCPLTTWEHDLRVAAGQPRHQGSFVGRLARDLLYVDVPLDSLQVILNVSLPGVFALTSLTLQLVSAPAAAIVFTMSFASCGEIHSVSWFLLTAPSPASVSRVREYSPGWRLPCAFADPVPASTAAMTTTPISAVDLI